MSRDRLNAGSYNHDAYSRQPGWPPTNSQTTQSSQIPQAPLHPPGSASGANPANSYAYPGTRLPPASHGNFAAMMMSPSVVDDRSFFQATPVPQSNCYSPAFPPSEASSDTRPSTSMDSDYRDRSAISSPATSLHSHVGPGLLRSEVGTASHSGAPVPERHSSRDVRKRAYDHAIRLDQVARKAGEDAEANLSVLAFSARSDTKDHSNNAPRIYISPQLEDAFRQRGITDVKAFLTSVAYDTRPRDDFPSAELVANLKQQVSILTDQLSMQQMDMSTLNSEVSRLKKENERLKQFAEGHSVVAAKLQEVVQLSYDYSVTYSSQSGLSGV